MSIFTSEQPKPPQEDPTVKALREREQQRAEDDRIRATQDQLKLETQQNAGLGVSSLLFRRRRSLLDSSAAARPPTMAQRFYRSTLGVG